MYPLDLAILNNDDFDVVQNNQSVCFMFPTIRIEKIDLDGIKSWDLESTSHYLQER